MSMADFLKARRDGRPYVGPPTARPCACGRRGAAQCEACGVSFCESHWWRHSHAEGPRVVLDVPAIRGSGEDEAAALFEVGGAR